MRVMRLRSPAAPSRPCVAATVSRERRESSWRTSSSGAACARRWLWMISTIEASGRSVCTTPSSVTRERASMVTDPGSSMPFFCAMEMSAFMNEPISRSERSARP